MSAVKLEALDRVRVLPSRRGGKVLRFTLKGQDSIVPVWTSLDGRADKWGTHTWRVEAPESIQLLIESARTSAEVLMAPTVPLQNGPGERVAH